MSMNSGEQHGPFESGEREREEWTQTLRTFPVSLMGCDAPMKLLIRAELTRGVTDSVDMSTSELLL